METKQPFKALSKICLNNWHYIDKKILTLNEGINFFTGHSGSGKSTVLEELNESTRLVIYPCIHTVLLGDDIRELLATFSEEDQIGDEAAIQSTLEDMPE